MRVTLQCCVGKRNGNGNENIGTGTDEKYVPFYAPQLKNPQSCGKIKPVKILR